MAKAATALETQKVSGDQQLKMEEIKHDYYATDAKVATDEAKLSGQGVIDLERQRMINESKLTDSLEERQAGLGDPTK